MMLIELTDLDSASQSYAVRQSTSRKLASFPPWRHALLSPSLTLSLVKSYAGPYARHLTSLEPTSKYHPIGIRTLATWFKILFILLCTPSSMAVPERSKKSALAWKMRSESGLVRVKSFLRRRPTLRLVGGTRLTITRRPTSGCQPMLLFKPMGLSGLPATSIICTRRSVRTSTGRLKSLWKHRCLYGINV
jgi:hypothetical protein